MATLEELSGLIPNTTLQNKIEAAVIIKATSILGEPSVSDGRKAWAMAALSSPRSAAAPLWRYAIGANKDATVAQIEGASDATLQSAVNAAADVLAGA